jgi:hypothetical protein
MTAINWKRRAERAESRYEHLRQEVQANRMRTMGDVVELADHRHYKTQVRALLLDAIELLDAISDGSEK